VGKVDNIVADGMPLAPPARAGVARPKILGVVRLCIGPPPRPSPIEERNWGRGNVGFCANSDCHKDIMFPSPIRVLRMGEAGWGSITTHPVRTVPKLLDFLLLQHAEGLAGETLLGEGFCACRIHRPRAVR